VVVTDTFGVTTVVTGEASADRVGVGGRCWAEGTHRGVVVVWSLLGTDEAKPGKQSRKWSKKGAEVLKRFVWFRRRGGRGAER
jgi:hypothetical protein